MENTRIILVGCGVMGNALKQGWERANAPFETVVIEPSNPHYLSNVDAVPEDFSPHVVLFAVKPQMLPRILPLYQRYSGRNCLFLSIAAGIPLATYHKILGKNESIIRAMPNLGVTVGQGMAVLVTNSSLTKAHQVWGQTIFEASGKVLWLEKESHMDIVTAVSGSGPAYFFRMVECLAAAGTVSGLPADVAMCLARQTAIGAGAMLQNCDESPTDMRIHITSPGGTTAAALSAFDQEDALAKLTRTAVKAAIQRGQELAQ
jgi:pyrroline-5-carboxylate reductase